MSDKIELIPSEINLFRKGLAAVQMLYYLSLFPRMNEFFGAQGWMKKKYWEDSISFLVLSESIYLRWFLVLLTFILLGMLYRGTLNRLGLVLLYLINLSFYDWNPYIIHEPQPIINLFFLSFLFLPLNQKQKYDPGIKKILIIFLGLYYFLAGAKKLADPNFLNGSALEYIISWTIMAKSVELNFYIVKYFSWLLRIMNYFILIFEISFIFLVFGKFRKVLIILGIIFHCLIYMTLEVGNFSLVMMVWYLLLLDNETLNTFKIIGNKS